LFPLPLRVFMSPLRAFSAVERVHDHVANCPRRVVHQEVLERVDWSDATVHVGVTREQIKQSPEYDPSGPVKRDYETRLHDHYARSSYWSDRRGERIMR